MRFGIVHSPPQVHVFCQKWLTEKKIFQAKYLQYLLAKTSGSCQCSINLKETNHTEFIASEEVSSYFELLLSLLPELWLSYPYSCLSAVLQPRALP